MGDERRRVAAIARHGRLRKRNPIGAIFKLLAGTLSVLLISTVAVGAVALSQVQGTIEAVELENEVEGAAAPDIGSFEGGFNILIVGSDECEYSDGCQGRGSARLNDVTMLVHVSGDQTNITAVSFPRDLVVPIPSCPREDGKGNYGAMSAQPINVTLSYGGLACTVKTVEALTGLEIPYAGLITFHGVVEMSTAVGGVTVCVNGPIIDRKANGINFPTAGNYTISGWEALGFLRTRYGVGDGSDLGRISNQQVYLSSLVRKVKSEDVLTNPAALFSLATTAARSMQLSTYLKNVNTMVSMANVLRKIDLEQVKFVQYPSTTGVGGIYAGKVAPIQGKADELFALIRADEPFSLVAGNTGRGSVLDPDAPEAPAPPEGEAAAPPVDGKQLNGVHGQSAADYTCSKANN
jgi:LCP family protein required for cell wall assembly